MNREGAVTSKKSVSPSGSRTADFVLVYRAFMAGIIDRGISYISRIWDIVSRSRKLYGNRRITEQHHN